MSAEILPNNYAVPFAQEVNKALHRLRGHAHRTPIQQSQGFDASAGVTTLFKCEQFQRTGAFKFRGAFNKLASLAPEQLQRGVIAFSSGNHAQAVALSARIWRIPAVLCMPEDAPQVKLAAASGYGAEIILYNRQVQDQEALAEGLARQRGLTLVPPANDPAIIAGHATVAWELLQDVSELDALIVPVGGGGLLVGISIHPCFRIFFASERKQTVSSTPPVIENISDTAFWVAYIRALESERPDALFYDPYARELSGERGARIAQSMPRGRKMNAWHVALRTRIIDEMLVQTIEQYNCDTVLNLAAGLDTRPYRLALPSSLQWIDVDLPAILSYKAEKLVGKQARCPLEQVKLDLTDLSSRRELFARINTQAKQVLVLMEGLSMYLTSEQLGSLVTDLHAQSGFRWLLTEYLSGEALQRSRKHREKHLGQGIASIQLMLDDSGKFYQAHGWETRQVRLIAEESHVYNRQMPLLWLVRLATFNNSQKLQKISRNLGGYALLEQTADEPGCREV